MIDSFRGRYAFLSNFSPSRIIYGGIEYPTVEHAFQAAKTLDIQERRFVKELSTPAEAKKAGRNLTLREDWEDVKIEIMLTCVRRKFMNPILRRKLLDTDKITLVEGNWWGDTFWGVYKGEGQNHLGRILMQVRREINESGRG